MYFITSPEEWTIYPKCRVDQLNFKDYYIQQIERRFKIWIYTYSYLLYIYWYISKTQDIWIMKNNSNDVNKTNLIIKIALKTLITDTNYNYLYISLRTD